jgi:formylglycine-generating enzyme required for sulfatase activity
MRTSSLEIMPKPFGWVQIPAGEMTLRTDKNHNRLWQPDYRPEWEEKRFQVSSFEIAKYPTTNAQYARFIEYDGYNKREWWTDAGWDCKTDEQWNEPLFWQDQKWNQPDYPVIGVSWYEAIAFCQWLTDCSSEHITLPTEQEWQRAAIGDTNWVVAYGPQVEFERFNWNLGDDGGIGTTPVTQYEGRGDSYFGVVDMSGNVWEWCRTKFEYGGNELDGKDSRVTRGGSWVLLYIYVLNYGADERYPLGPAKRTNHHGFRCARYS